MASMNIPELFSDENREVFDVIDSVRSLNLSRYVNLPEIIVCGDQSAGKSSVLDAISGMRFAVKDGLCTRFATELVLRRDPEESVHVSILPGGDRSDRERQDLEAWRPVSSIEDGSLEALTEEAKAKMATAAPRQFYHDILRIEITGPNQPHLTMVDLPGIFRAGNSEQSADDAEFVEALMMKNMTSPRSIILAVVSAKNGYVLQNVASMAKKADPEGRRTIGLITKPDDLDVGSESESAYVNLAQNKDVKLRLGWHVLRNRSYEERDSSSAERDAKEEEFLSRGLWASVDPAYCGAKALRERLSTVLKDQIIQQMPSLVQEVEQGVRECAEKLQLLGPVRQTTAQQRIYLGHISHQYNSLMKQSVDGSYAHDFFGNRSNDAMYNRRIRAVVRNLLEEFGNTMHSKGKAFYILEHPSDAEVDGEREANNSPVVKRSEYLDNVTDLLKYNKGCELPGLFNPMIIGDLFYDQCKPWRNIAQELVDNIANAAQMTVDLLVEHLVAKDVAGEILKHIREKMDRLRSSLQSKMEELLPSPASHPISYNPDLTTLVQRAQNDRYKRAIQNLMFKTFGEKLNANSAKAGSVMQLMSSIVGKFEVDMKNYGSSVAVDYMEAYYKLAVESFIDNVGKLGVENCVMEQLPGLLKPTEVMNMSDDELSRLASESPKSAVERADLLQMRETLEKVLPVLKGFQRRHRSNVTAAPPKLPEDYSTASEIDRDSNAEYAIDEDTNSVRSSMTDATDEHPSTFVMSKARQSRPYYGMGSPVSIM